MINIKSLLSFDSKVVSMCATDADCVPGHFCNNNSACQGMSLR